MFTVGTIEQMLFAAYPAEDAQEGDRIGLLVGDRSAGVTRIAVALDQTVPMVEAAAQAGCNLLVTHHPAFWLAPTSFESAASAATADGAVVYAAARRGVALLTMHTNLDSAPSAASMLLAPVGLEFVETLQKTDPALLGQIARPINPLSLDELARNYQRAFGRVAKVWGNPAQEIARVAVCSGGAGEVIPDVLAAGVDCFVTGEVRHHEELYLADEGIALIELGHDISELPYRFELEKTLIAGGFSPEGIVILDPSATWWQVHGDGDRQS